MITEQQVPNVIGATAYSTAGDKIGKVGDIYFDDRTGAPAWLTVHTGMFGKKETFIPTQASNRRHNGDIEVSYDKDMVKDAPRVEIREDFLSEAQQNELYSYYGMAPDGSGADGHAPSGLAPDGRATGAAAPPPRGTPANAGPTAGGDDAMTRSEEHMRVGTERVETGRARLRKYVVTENVQTTVPVSHEEIRVEREPITEGNRGEALRGPAISEGEHEVTLHAERPVVEKVAEPVERVRLTTESVTDEETVSGQVRQERIEIDDEAGRTKPPQR